MPNLLPSLRRKLFIVLLGDDKHGKSTILQELAEFGSKHQKSYHPNRPIGLLKLYCENTVVDAYIFRRSYQEYLMTEKGYKEEIERAIEKEVGADWFNKDLIIMPLHCSCRSKVSGVDLARRLIDFVRGYGFDVIVAYIILDSDELKNKNCCREILKLSWDKRWELYNPRISPEDKNKIQKQCEYLAIVLLQRICSEFKC